MTLRKYEWKDLETLRKYFGMTQEDLANELDIARTTLSAVSKNIVRKERKRHYETIVGMFWEIFAIYYVKSYRVTKDSNPHYCYDLLLDYANDMKDLRKIDRLNFSEWYARKEFEE